MGFDAFLQQILNFTGTLNVTLVVLLFVICAVGEFAVGVPYLLETIWLLAGYHVGNGTLSPLDLIILWPSAQAGRQVGSMGLYFVGRAGSAPIVRFQQRLFETRLFKRFAGKAPASVKSAVKINYLSPFSVAIGRLFWLRIPLSITLGIKKQLKILTLGVLLSSIIWDGVYLAVGLAGASATIKPLQMALYSIIGITALYAITFGIRRIRRRSAKNNRALVECPRRSDFETPKNRVESTECNRR